MTDTSVESNKGVFMHNALETVIRVGVIILLAVWCFDIVKPFIGILAWAIIITIAVRPLYERLAVSMGHSTSPRSSAMATSKSPCHRSRSPGGRSSANR